MKLVKVNRNLVIAAAVVVLVAVVAVAAFVFLRTVPTAAIRFVPEQTQAQVGQDIDVNITISDVRNLFGWEIKMRWNTTLLEIVNVAEGEFLKANNETFFFPQINNTAGYIVADCTFVENATGIDGQGVLATVTLRVKASGSCILEFYETMLLNPAEQEIAHGADDGQFTGTAPTQGFD